MEETENRIGCLRKQWKWKGRSWTLFDRASLQTANQQENTFYSACDMFQSSWVRLMLGGYGPCWETPQKHLDKPKPSGHLCSSQTCLHLGCGFYVHDSSHVKAGKEQLFASALSSAFVSLLYNFVLQVGKGFYFLTGAVISRLKKGQSCIWSIQVKEFWCSRPANGKHRRENSAHINTEGCYKTSFRLPFWKFRIC